MELYIKICVSVKGLSPFTRTFDGSLLIFAFLGKKKQEEKKKEGLKHSSYNVVASLCL